MQCETNTTLPERVSLRTRRRASAFISIAAFGRSDWERTRDWITSEHRPNDQRALGRGIGRPVTEVVPPHVVRDLQALLIHPLLDRLVRGAEDVVAADMHRLNGPARRQD